MRKFLTISALGCLALATAADAHVADATSWRCAHGAADIDTVVEMARLDPRGGGDRFFA